MDWRDEGILLDLRRHGESATIVSAFTAAHGRHGGLWRGGGGRRATPVQPGAQVDLAWRARLEDHLGNFEVEPLRSRAGALMSDPLALAGLAAACRIMHRALPERQAMPDFYARSVQLLDLMVATPAWPLAYLRWEVALLAEMGVPLDLARCAVTGAETGLAHVSPRTGRAVTREGAGAWADRLLPLPPCLLGEGEAANPEIAVALGTTGHFLSRELGAGLPPMRARLIDLLARSAAS